MVIAIKYRIPLPMLKLIVIVNKSVQIMCMIRLEIFWQIQCSAKDKGASKQNCFDEACSLMVSW